MTGPFQETLERYQADLALAWRAFVSVLKENRIHGDEFCLVLPSTLLDQAARCLTSLRRQLNRDAIKCRLRGDLRRITLSFSAGVTNVIAADTLESVLDRADSAMYIAKRNGSGVEVVRI